jgi:hypothetical protein
MNDLPETAIGTLRLMPAKTDEIVRFSRQLVQSVKDGNTNPLELLVMLRSLEAVSEMVREDIEENILKEADKYSEKVIEQYGARIEKKDVGVKYAYASSQDVQWEQLDSQIAGLSLRKRQREEFLRALKEPMTVVDEETGEVTKIHPPYRTSKQGVAVYLK